MLASTLRRTHQTQQDGPRRDDEPGERGGDGARGERGVGAECVHDLGARVEGRLVGVLRGRLRGRHLQVEQGVLRGRVHEGAEDQRDFERGGGGGGQRCRRLGHVLRR